MVPPGIAAEPPVSDQVFHPAFHPVCRQAFHPVCRRVSGQAVPGVVAEAPVSGQVVPEVVAEAPVSGQAVPEVEPAGEEAAGSME